MLCGLDKHDRQGRHFRLLGDDCSVLVGHKFNIFGPR